MEKKRDAGPCLGYKTEASGIIHKGICKLTQTEKEKAAHVVQQQKNPIVSMSMQTVPPLLSVTTKPSLIRL